MQPKSSPNCSNLLGSSDAWTKALQGAMRIQASETIDALYLRIKRLETDVAVLEQTPWTVEQHENLSRLTNERDQARLEYAAYIASLSGKATTSL